MPLLTSETFYQFLLALPIVLFSLAAHEFMHAYVSHRLGDPTAKDAGRLTLSPLAHLDPIGTLMLVASSLSGFGFGWAKPVPINPAYYRNPVKGTFQVSLAGPLTNLALAIPFGLLIRFWIPPYVSWAIRLEQLLWLGMSINLGLFLFNLIPLPPLDGSEILAYFLRRGARERYMQLQQYGPLILIMLVLTRLINFIIMKPFSILVWLLTGQA